MLALLIFRNLVQVLRDAAKAHAVEHWNHHHKRTGNKRSDQQVKNRKLAHLETSRPEVFHKNQCTHKYFLPSVIRTEV